MRNKLRGAEDVMAERVLLVELGIDATNDDILDQMRTMKTAREERTYDTVVCSIRGFSDDARELYEIPEVRGFCRRVVNLGFISYLDFSTIFNPEVPDLAKQGWGAAEVWLCGEGRLKTMNPLTRDILHELQRAVVESNAKADAALRPMA
jgi:hypothetical protein